MGGALIAMMLLFPSPLTLIGALAYGVMNLVKVAKVDAEYAKRGETPPTHRLIEKWLEGRKAAGKAPRTAKVAKPGMWAYAWQRWQAMWADLADRHREVREAYLRERATALAYGRQPPPKPTVKETLTGWKWQLDQLQPPAAGAGRQPAVDAPATPTEQATGPDLPAPGEVCRRCGWHDPSIDDTGVCGTCRGADQYPGRHGAPTEGENMTHPNAARADNPETSGEVTGIPSAVHYMTQVAATHTAHGGNEQLITAMVGMRIGDGDTALVQQAQEKSRNAADLWTTAATTIDRHNAGVREGYGSAPDAADKHAQMAE